MSLARKRATPYLTVFKNMIWGACIPMGTTSKQNPKAKYRTPDSALATLRS